MKAHVFDPRLLHAYDMRGVVGDSLTQADAHALGRAFAVRVHRIGGTRVAVGYDGRLSSPMLEAALVEGLRAGGIAVRRIGLGPTPMLYDAVASAEEVQGGIQVTGSHNPKDHNGFKMVLGGQPFFGDDIFDCARIAAAGDWHWSGPVGAVESVDVTGAYRDRLLAALDGIDPAELARLRIGWDTGNGAAGPMVEALAARLPGLHHTLFSQVDGHFPHHHPDPTIEANLRDLRETVVARQLDFGFAFDGDGDRLGLVDARGRVIWGDELLLILAQDMLQRHPGARILADVKTSMRVFEAIADWGGEAVMWASGHSLIKSGMKQTGALLAGEMTGHLFFADDFPGHDDALYAALRIIAACVRLGTSPTALRDALPESCATPELRFAVPGRDPHAVMAQVLDDLASDGIDFVAIDGARVASADGWWLLRASNTQALLTARAEARDAAGLARLLEALDARLARVGVTRIA